MKQVLKNLVKEMPYLKPVFQDREQLRRDRERAIQERDQANAQVASLQVEWEKLLAEKDRLAAEKDRLLTEKDRLLAEKDRFLTEKDGLIARKDSLTAERDQAAKERDQWRQYQFVPPGHFYSPVPSLEELKQHEGEIWGQFPKDIPGVDLNEAGQLNLFEALKTYYPEMPAYETRKKEGLRYFYKNGYFPLGDALILYGMIRHLRPKRIIEIGSGFSSAVTLDTNHRFFDHRIACTFIEPYPARLFSLMEEGDRARCEVMEGTLQQVPLSCFEQLAANDILFIDSTHVTKTHSDVNYYFFQILPALAPGVCIHIHDVFYPFEYPQSWVYQGITWNEDYMVRAFLQYNQNFQIQFFNSFLEQCHPEFFRRDMPLYLADPGGSLWLKKL